jgi:hypothetical protein
MKRLFLTSALLLITATVWSQPTGAGTDAVPPASTDSESARGRIQAERAREAARYQSEEAACYLRFAVSDCLRKARVQRRQVLDELRRQELVLNDAERQRKAQVQLESIKEKSSAQQAKEASVRRPEAGAAQQEREARARQRAAASGVAKPGQVDGQSPNKTVKPMPSMADLAKEQKQYNDKLKEAQEHRTNREKSSSEKSGSSARPLPLEP